MVETHHHHVGLAIPSAIGLVSPRVAAVAIPELADRGLQLEAEVPVMSVIFYLLPLAIMLALVGLVGFFWAVSDGQFDDLEGPRWRVLFEESEPRHP